MWCCVCEQAKQLVGVGNFVHDLAAHEDEPKDLPVGISIQNLTKIYDEVMIIYDEVMLNSTFSTPPIMNTVEPPIRDLLR